MITNERQYRITNSQLKRIEEAINSFDIKKATESVKSELLAKAEIDALRSEYSNLAAQLLEYETLKSGTVEYFRASNLEELSSILIKARISKGLSQRKLAELVGVKEQQIQRYEAEQYISANLIRLSQIAKALDLNISEIAEFKTFSEPIKMDDEVFNWDEFPVKEMYKKNWFQDFFSGSLPEAIRNARELVREFILNTYDRPLSSAARQCVRSTGIVNQYALFAWQCRVIDLARKIKLLKKFSISSLTKEWFNTLIKFSAQDNGVQKALVYLYESGIRVVIQPHLSRTHLDGAVFLLKGGPVIGMTLRYDRLDNFWFVLLHELVHIRRHLHAGKIESIFDDLDADAIDIEVEADYEAGEILIPAQIWETALPRYIQNDDAIVSFANELGISPAIIAGKIRREMNNYSILNNLVGQGEVRNKFPNIDFSY